MNRFVIAGTGSGVGKTTITIGLMRAFMKRNLTVQGFKCGPDYIDPSYHTAVTRRISRNLDSFMLTEEVIKTIVANNSQDVDVSIIEGVMGFYDGISPLSNNGSTAHISEITKSPVILIVNGESMARSVAAIVKGFQLFNDLVNIAGVIVNQLGGEGHFHIVKQAIEQECHVPVIGFLPKGAVPSLPSRHLGLVPAIERGEIDFYFDELAQVIEQFIDLDLLLEITKANNLSKESTIFDEGKSAQRVHIAVAKDEAFNFYYEENFELLKANGAILHFFSPLNNETVPKIAQGLYIGGGFPEEFAERLSTNKEAAISIKETVEKGIPTFAECGGFMYLTESIETCDGQVFEMVGVIPGRVKMQNTLAAIGYRDIVGLKGNFLITEDESAKGHEFHYSVYEGEHESPAYNSKRNNGLQPEGYVNGNVVAGYTHLHFASNPKLVSNWLMACLRENPPL